MKQILLKIILIFTIVICSIASTMLLIYGNPFKKSDNPNESIMMAEPAVFDTSSDEVPPAADEGILPASSSPAA